VCGTYTRFGRIEEGQVAKSFKCADAGVVCNAKVTGDSDEEVLAKAVEHAKQAHGVDLAQSTTLAGFARSLIKDEGRSGD
jgi:predicted small metal-binding protein